MKGDFSRQTFNAKKHYTAVLMQQGRVQVDADWNEQQKINQHRQQTTTHDLIGPCGVPEEEDGFAIASNNGEFSISAGRLYVDGILCENEEQVEFHGQPDYPEASPTEFDETQKYLFYLDVWERHLTSLDDSEIQEVALGGADTATRSQIIWQVKAKACDAPTCSTACLEEAPSTGKLKAQTNSTDPITDPLCQLPPTSGYRGLENQLYRVEIHHGGTLEADNEELDEDHQVTFKWSRENGSVVTAIDDIDYGDTEDEHQIITVKDNVLGFASNQWVEVIDDRLELQGKPGYLVLIETVDPTTLKITLHTSTKLPPDAVNDQYHRKLRRWEQPKRPEQPEKDQNGLVITPSTWIPLEDGVEVWFSAESDSNVYQTGDYWLIPARTITADIEWPTEEEEPLQLPPLGIKHHYGCLAIASFEGTSWQITDCRPIFSSLTHLGLFYVGGDGQEAMPNQQLPYPLQVGVVRGWHPVAGIQVKFTVEEGGGSLADDLDDEGNSYTDDQGIASIDWTLGESGSQRVKAELINEEDTLPIYFSANLSIAENVAYKAVASCQQLQKDETVKDALDHLCQVCQPHQLNEWALGFAVAVGLFVFTFLQCFLTKISGDTVAYLSYNNQGSDRLTVCLMTAIIYAIAGFGLGWLIAFCYNKMTFTSSKP